MRRWMVAAGAAGLLAAASVSALEQVDGASAGVDVKIADDVRNGEGRFSGFDYAKSDRLGHAWLVLHYRYRAPCLGSDAECEADDPLRVSVPGLTYDPATKQVLYERDGAEPVPCANVRRGGFLSGFQESLAPTDKCTYRLVRIDRFLDDGFAGRRDRREEIHFSVALP